MTNVLLEFISVSGKNILINANEIVNITLDSKNNVTIETTTRTFEVKNTIDAVKKALTETYYMVKKVEQV